MTNLSVNVNKVALIRNSRKGEVPCLENFSRIRYVRRNIARIKTLIVEKSLKLDSKVENENA